MRSGVYALFATMPESFAAHLHIQPLAPDGRVLGFMLVAAAASADRIRTDAGDSIDARQRGTRIPRRLRHAVSQVDAARACSLRADRRERAASRLRRRPVARSDGARPDRHRLPHAERRADVDARQRPGTSARPHSRGAHVRDRSRARRVPPLDGGLDQLLVATSDSTVAWFDLNVVSPEYFCFARASHRPRTRLLRRRRAEQRFRRHRHASGGRALVAGSRPDRKGSRHGVRLRAREHA